MQNFCGGAKCSMKNEQIKRKRDEDPVSCYVYAPTAHIATQQATVKLFSAYYGELPTPCVDLGNGNVRLSAVVPGLKGQPDVFVQCYDAVANKLEPTKYSYTYASLLVLPVIERNIQQLKTNYDQIVTFKAKGIKNLTPAEMVQYSALLVYNNAVDVQFGSCHYVNFLHKRLNMNNIAASNLMLSIVNIPRLDNAFFNGKVMNYGNGDTLFLPMGTFDIIAHENAHSIVQSTAGLIYEAHAGALNESFADILGCSFERYIYNQFNKDEDKTNDLQGDFDWMMGEDNARTFKYLRNMQDPEQCEMPQPSTYKGKYWVVPVGKATQQNDYLGVHTDSGPWNRCFYDFAQKTSIMDALNVFVACLKKLKTNSDYMNARDTIKKVCPPPMAEKLQSSLNLVGLNDAAVSDWKK